MWSEYSYISISDILYVIECLVPVINVCTSLVLYCSVLLSALKQEFCDCGARLSTMSSMVGCVAQQ